jgi:uncharacterized membrane protein
LLRLQQMSPAANAVLLSAAMSRCFTSAMSVVLRYIVNAGGVSVGFGPQHAIDVVASFAATGTPAIAADPLLCGALAAFAGFCGTNARMVGCRRSCEAVQAAVAEHAARAAVARRRAVAAAARVSAVEQRTVARAALRAQRSAAYAQL